MSQNYEHPFDELRNQIIEYSLSSIPLLDQLKADCGAQIAYFAAFVIVCVKAKQDAPNLSKKYDPAPDDLKDFTFFTLAQDTPVALALFDRLLLCYKRDRFAD